MTAIHDAGRPSSNREDAEASEMCVRAAPAYPRVVSIQAAMPQE